MYIGSKESVLRAYLKHNTPANLWFFAKNNGIVQVMHARAALLHLNEKIKALKPGHATPHFSIWKVCQVGEVMHFTNRPEAVDTELERRVGGTAGSLREFERFKEHFVLLENPLLQVPTPNELLMYKGRSLGFYNSPADFQNVLDEARSTVQRSEREFLKV